MNDPAVPAPAHRRLSVVLLAVVAVGLVLLGAGAAVALGIGRGPAPSAVDVGFSRDMAHHHLQGVEMANVARERSTDAEVRQLAFDIAATQTNQAGRMQGWLSLWGEPVTGGEPMAWMTGADAHAGHDAGGRMPGMATEEELAELRQLSGTAFDVQFLRLMMRHHQGGLDMAVEAAARADIAAVRRLADTVAQTQSAETTTMARMLTARGGTPLPAP